MPLQFNPFTGTFDVTTKGDTGNVSAAGDGTAAAPGITFASDTNTGIYRPGEDQLALSTNGTGRLFIDANGNFGLTAASPAWGDSVNGSRAIQIGGSSWYQYRTSIINFGHGYYYDAADTYRYLYTGTPVSYCQQTAGEHRWFNAASGTAGNTFTPTERLRITSTGQLSHIGAGSSGSPAVSFSGSAPSNSLVVDSSGNVGIGASPLTNSVVINRGTEALLRLQSSVSGGTGSDGVLLSIDSANQGYLWNYENASLILGTNNTPRLTITSAGSVGIGTSAPDRRLTVANTGGDSTFNILASATGESVLYFADSTSGTGSYAGYLQYIHSTDNLAIGCAAGEAIRIDSSKRVGIGTTSPGAVLEVFKSSYPTAKISDGTRSLEIGINSDAGNPKITFATDSASSLCFASSTTERGRFDASGRFLVGTSSNSGGALLQVNGDRIRVATAKTPASATDTGTAGEICWDANYIYVCTATNTWKRTAIATW